jgi:hypothetical protein
MARLSKTDSAALMALVDRPGWQALIKLASMTINDLNSRKASGGNEFEVLRSVFTREAKVEALQEFFDGIEKGESLSDIQK